MTAKPLIAADLFCGAGGTTSGLQEACNELGIPVQLTAINHWPVAVATHQRNHPDARHLCASLDALNPRDLYEEGELDALWASPECRHHSAARGGRPVSDQSRATAWCVVRWAEALRPPIIWVENVREFLHWGPIGATGKPLKSKRGATFRAWVQCLESLGYRVEWRVLCAADFGDPTTRRRLFIQAVRGQRRIVWPSPTHADDEWVAAREIIDWSDLGRSIFDRERPLAEKTMRRIMIGLERYAFAPFIASWDQQSSTNGVWSEKQPLSSVTTKARHGVVQPFLIKLRGTGTVSSIEDPVPAITAGGQHIGVAQPYLVDVAHGNGKDRNGDSGRARSIERPLPTVTCGHANGDGRNIGLCQPFVLGQQSGAVARPVSEPIPTVATSGAIGLCHPFLSQCHIGGQRARNYSIDEPLAGKQPIHRVGLVQPYLVKFYKSGTARPVTEPLDTVTTKPRFGLCRPIVELNGETYQLDILFRMLKPRELARAQGFPDSYEFTGNNSEVVRQIGNAVPRRLAKAIVRAALTQTP